MSINLTISADSAADFFKHLRELNAGFHWASVSYGTSADTAAHIPETTVDDAPTVTVGATEAETTASPEPKAARKPRAAKTETVEPTVASATKSEGEARSPVDSTGEETASGIVTAASPSEDPGKVGPYPDFDTEVTPVVLGAVRAKGKEWVSAVLSEFGVEKASQLADSRFQELIDTINDRLA